MLWRPKKRKPTLFCKSAYIRGIKSKDCSPMSIKPAEGGDFLGIKSKDCSPVPIKIKLAQSGDFRGIGKGSFKEA